MDINTAQKIAKTFGFRAREHNGGFFLNTGRDDLVLVKPDGDIVHYAHDAQAHLVAMAIQQAMRS